MNSLVFLKLGGSLITEKTSARTARLETIHRIAQEIAGELRNHPEIRLLLGHGSGSFGHVSAYRYGTRQGVATPEGWRGFAEVWHDARELNQIVLESLHAAGLPVIAYPPSACIVANHGEVESWDLSGIKRALEAGLIPVVNGDVAVDRSIGGTILSTEDVFHYLAKDLQPDRILLAGIEQGVWADFPACTRLVEVITPADRERLAPSLKGSAAVDVTGGMADKVTGLLELVGAQAHLEGMIFSGEGEGDIGRALGGATFGTLIRGLPSKE